MKGLVTSAYNGQPVSFNDLGWFNATEASKPHGKRPIDWLRLDETQNYISALCEQLRISEPKSLIKARRNSGTWLHPKLAVPFARWLDVRFGVWCDLQVDQLLRGTHPIFDRQRLRHQTASTYKAVTAILKQTLENQGKEVKRHHFMNEARLINWALNGEFKGLDRDSLSDYELDLLAHLEMQDLILIASQCSYEQRKTALKGFATSYQAKRLENSQALLGAIA